MEAHYFKKERKKENPLTIFDMTQRILFSTVTQALELFKLNTSSCTDMIMLAQQHPLVARLHQSNQQYSRVFGYSRCWKSLWQLKKKIPFFRVHKTTGFLKAHSEHRPPTNAQCKVPRKPVSCNTEIFHQKLDSGKVFFRPKERVWYFTLCKVP